MFQNSWTSDGAVFGDVTHEDHRKVALFGNTNQVASNLANLSGHAGGTVEVAVSDGLNRVNHEQVWVNRIDLPEHAGEVCF